MYCSFCCVIVDFFILLLLLDGLDDVVSAILTEAHNRDLPAIFTLNRKRLARALDIRVPVSIVGLLTYNGVYERYKTILELSLNARSQYIEMLQKVEKTNY